MNNMDEMKITGHKFEVSNELAHLSDYINTVRRRKWLVILFFMTVVFTVTLYSFLATPVYRATAQLIMEKQSYSVIRTSEVSQGSYTEQQDYYQTQYNLLKSRNLAYKVIEELGLNMDDAGLGGFRQISDDGIRPAVIDWYLENLDIEAVEGKQLIYVSFTGRDREILPNIVMTHVKNFIEISNQTRKATADTAFQWIKTQLENQKLKLEEVQGALHKYTKEQDIVSIDGSESIVAQKLVDLNSALTKAKSDRIAKEAVYIQLKNFSLNNESIYSLPEIKQDTVIQTLRAQLAQGKAEQLELASHYGEKHPRMIEAATRIKQIEDNIKSEVERINGSIKIELNRAFTLENALQNNLAEQKQETMDLNERSIGYDLLKQQAESEQKIYDMLLQQAKEISLLSVMDSSNVRIVDMAEKPTLPIRPRIFLNIVLAAILGLFLGISLAFFMDYMDNTVKTAEDAQRHLGIPVLGMLPYRKEMKSGNNLLPLPELNEKTGVELYQTGKKTSYDHSYWLPSSYQISNQGHLGRIILVESATAGEGKTTVISNMALNFSLEGNRVVVVDYDLKRPNLCSFFNIKENGKGFSQAVANFLRHNLVKGSLEDYTMDDLFFLISLKRRSCRLKVVDVLGQIIAVQFQNGRFAHIQSENNPPNNRLGTMLLNGGYITENQLKDALDRGARTGQPLGYILINSGYLRRDQLQGPLRLQTEEHLQKLFTWRNAVFELDEYWVENSNSEKINFDEDFSPVIKRLGNLNGNRFIENEILSNIISFRDNSLYVLPVGTKGRWDGRIFNVQMMSKFLDILKRRFDLVLVDAPPIMDAPGSAPLSSMVDGIVMVIKAGGISYKILNEAMSNLDNSKIIGTIINQSRIKQDYYYRK